jgi:hypothetical protein
VKSRPADIFNSASLIKIQKGVCGPRPNLHTKEAEKEYAQPQNERLPVE